MMNIHGVEETTSFGQDYGRVTRLFMVNDILLIADKILMMICTITRNVTDFYINTISSQKDV